MQQLLEPFLRAVEEEYGEEIAKRCRHMLTEDLFSQEATTQMATLEFAISEVRQFELQEAARNEDQPLTSDSE